MTSVSKRGLVKVIVLAFLVANPPLADCSLAEDSLAELVSSGNSSSIQMLRTYYAKTRMQSMSLEGKPGLAFTSEYWRTGPDFRLREDEGHRVVHFELKKGQGRITTTVSLGDTRPDPKRDVAVQLVGKDRRATQMDPWELSLFQLPIGIFGKPPLAIYQVDQLIKHGVVREARWVTIDGGKQAHLLVGLPDERRSYEIWSDPAHNWLLSRAVHRTFNAEGRVEAEIDYRIQAFTEAKPGIYVPTRIACSWIHQSTSGVRAEVILSELVVNETLRQVPSFPEPPVGSRVIDETAGTSFLVGTGGKRIGPITRLGEHVVPLSEPESAPTVWSLNGIVGGLALFVAIGLMIVGLFALARSRANHRLR